LAVGRTAAIDGQAVFSRGTELEHFSTDLAEKFGTICLVDPCVLKLIDKSLKVSRHPRQFEGRLARVPGAIRGGVGSFGHCRDALGDLGAAFGRFRDVLRDLRGRRRLLLDGTGDGILEIIDLTNDLADLANGLNRVFRIRLDRLDFIADILGSLRGLLGQFLDFVGDNRKALSGFSGAGGFDGGVDRCARASAARQWILWMEP